MLWGLAPASPAPVTTSPAATKETVNPVQPTCVSSLWSHNQRDDATLSTLPACHLFGCGTKEMMQPCPLYLRAIYLVAAPKR